MGLLETNWIRSKTICYKILFSLDMSCQIVLENFNGSYYPGDTISGRIICVFRSDTEFRGIRIRVRGKEHTSWWERESYYDASSKKTKHRNVHYTGNNTILSYNSTLVGEGSSSAGRYEYPFSCTLPRDLPTTYNGSYGSIKYYIKANVDIPFGFDYEDERPFVIISLVNFNQMTEQLQLNPVEYDYEQNLCCCCCASEPITMNVQLQKEAFVLGEKFKIKVIITNMSNTSSDGLSIQISMTVESKTTSPSTKYKRDKELVASTSDTGVGAHGQRIYEFDLEIPRSTVLPNFIKSTLFKQWCILNVEAEIPGCHSNLNIETSIVLGHIGIENPTTTLPLQYPITNNTGGTLPRRPDDSKPPPYPMENAAPPYPSCPPSEIGFMGLGATGESSTNRMPVPVHGLYPPGPSSSAPSDQTAPSAPKKAEMAANDEFVMFDEGSGSPEPPPPSYNDIIGKEK